MQTDSPTPCRQTINDRIHNYFCAKELSVEGFWAAADRFGKPYVTYGVSVSGVDVDEITASAIDGVENLIDGLVRGKTHEKPEAGLICVRACQVHWRKYPAVELGEEGAKVLLRISIHHKPTAEATQ